MNLSLEKILSIFNKGEGSTKHQQKRYEVVNVAYQRYCRDEKIDIANIGIKYKNESEKNLLEIICELGNKYVYENEIDKNLYAEGMRILTDDSGELTEDNLLLMEMFLIGSGLYEMAYKAREVCSLKKIERYELKKKVNSKDAFPLFWSYIQLGKMQEASEIFHRAGERFRKGYKREIDFLQGIVTGERSRYVISEPEPEDLSFVNYIKGKRILIVGPAENGNDVEKYISEHDVVISMIYRRNLGIDIKDKPHISYYSGLACKNMREEERECFEDLDLVVFKKARYDFQKEMLKNGKTREACGYKTESDGKDNQLRVNMLYYNKCSSNLLQVILVDLLLYAPEKITVINTNLFLAKKRYNDKYKVTGTIQNKKSFRRSFAIHNMMNMYQLTKLLYDSGVIEVDEVCKEVLNLGVEEYVKQMQELEA